MSTNLNADKKKGFLLTLLNNEQSLEEKNNLPPSALQFDSDIPEGGSKNNLPVNNVSSKAPSKPAADEFGARNFSTQSPQREPDWVRQSKGIKTPPAQKHSAEPEYDATLVKSTLVGGESPQVVVKASQAPRLMQTLVESGVVSKETMDQALEIQKKNADKRRLIDVLVEDFAADKEAIFRTVAKHYSFETIDPTPIYGDKEKLQYIRQMLETLPPLYYDMAVRLKVLPYELYSNGYDKLTIITRPISRTPDSHQVARAFKFPKYEIRYVSLEHFNELWRQLAFDQSAKQLGLEGEEGFSDLDKDGNDKDFQKSLEDEIGRGKLNELVEGLFVDGVRTGASDIHVIPKGSHRTEFHFRIDGGFSLWSAITDVRAEAILTVIKDRAKNLDGSKNYFRRTVLPSG